jgi:sugar (glycoside-pentoside-hexuronide) transporter
MGAERAPAGIDPRDGPETLPWHTKLVYGLGDHTVNVSLSSLTFFFVYFLTDVAGLRPALAGLVPLVGRVVDAFTDPLMGRLSDVTRWRRGRRRPYFLIGMLPFGAFFAALWWDVPWQSPTTRFAYYAAAYVLYSCAVTVLSVPYLALIPEMASSYQERTSVNTYRAALAIAGTLLAVTTMRPLADAFGGGAGGFAAAGAVFGVWLSAPWLLVHAVTFERPARGRAAPAGFLDGVRSLARHPAYRSLTGLYLLGRIALDLTSAMFLYYFTHWLRRPDDFELVMGIFLVAVVLALPIWLAVSRRTDKRTIFLLGAASWVGAQAFLLAVDPAWPRWSLVFVAALAGAGYAAADMIPWSMLGEVVDEDELRTGQRREGMYFGFFTFLRKLGGASAVAIALFALDLAGFAKDRPQTGATLLTIRVLTAGVPGLFVLLAAWVALRYPLTRARHAEIQAVLLERRAAAETR